MATPPTLIVPSASVSPAGASAAGCVCQRTATDGGTGESDDTSSVAYQNYRYTAIPARGWRFKAFAITVTRRAWCEPPVNPNYPGQPYTDRYYITDESETHTDSEGSTYTFSHRKAVWDATVGGYVYDSLSNLSRGHCDGGVRNSWGHVAHPAAPSTPEYDYYHVVESESVIAIFEREATHLLVNSSDRSEPVQLVYDPTTNLLIADW